MAVEASRFGHGASRRLPEGTAFVAAMAALLGALGLGGIVLEPSGAILPFDTGSLDPIDAVVSAVVLIALAVGLARGKRLAWYLAIAAFGSALILQLVVLGHVIAGVVAAACLCALAVHRVRFRVATDRSRVVLAIVALVLGVILVSAEAVAIDTAPGQMRASLAALADWLSMSDPVSIGANDAEVVMDLMALLARVLLALAALALLRAVAERATSSTERARAIDVGQRYGTGALLPFQFGPGTRPFFGPDGDSIVVFGRAGRTVVMLGDPIGPSSSWPTTLAAFVGRCEQRDLIVTVYQASPSAVPTLMASGFDTFKVGQEAIIELVGFSIEGSRRANLRHTVTRARRGRVTIEWHPNGLGRDDRRRLGDGLVALDRAWQGDAGPRLGFTIGTFSLDDLSLVTVAVALGSDGTPIALTTFRPTDSAGGWVLDLVRRHPGSTPGAVESCIVEAAHRLLEMGGRELSLGLVPLAGLDGRSGSGPERLLASAARYARSWYDVDGLAFFKGKFDPRWEPRYGAVRHRRDVVGFSIALLRLHLAGPDGALQVAGHGALAAADSARSG